MLAYNPSLKNRSRNLRRTMTDAEQLLWSKLRGKQIHQVQFYRPKPLAGFIVDFYSAVAKLGVMAALDFNPDSLLNATNRFL